MSEPDSSSQVESGRNRLAKSIPATVSSSMGSSKNDKNENKSGTILIEDANPPTADDTLSSTTKTMNLGNKVEKICRVCGDKAKSFHFGGLACDSCKAFFRRSVHNKAFESFQCTGATPGENCHISLNSRKSCQLCRFQKCLAIGMEKKWVMTEEERKTLNKQRKEKKEEKSTTRAPFPPRNKPLPENYEADINEMLKFMTIEERNEIESIVHKYQHSYKEIPFSAPQNSGSRNPVEIVGMFTTILRRFAYFTKLLPEFCNLSVDDQSTLLRGGVLEMVLLRSALAFDVKNNRWPRTDNLDFLKDCPQLKVEDMERLVSKELFQMHMKFITGIQELKADEPVVMVLLLVVLFHPERGNLQDPGYVSEVQEKYVMLLNKYTQWRYGPTSSKAFPKLLTKLADLRELNDSHTEYNLKMSRKEVDTIQEQLGHINLNPYPQWVLVQDQRAGKGQGASKAMKDAMMNMGGMGMPSTREMFINFVNNKIPALIENPFLPMDMMGEMMAGMASIGNMFQQFQQQAQGSIAAGTAMSGGQIPNFQYMFPQGHQIPTMQGQSQGHAQYQTQSMEEYLQSDLILDRGQPSMQMPSAQQQQAFFSAELGHQYMGMSDGHQGHGFNFHNEWASGTNLQEEYGFPDQSAMIHHNQEQIHHSQEGNNQSWRNTQNY